MLVIWFGVFACVGVAISSLPAEVSLRGALALGQAAGRLDAFHTEPSLRAPYTIWEGLIAGTFLALGYFGCDQSQVQRYLASRNLTHSRLSLLFNAALKIPMQFLILLTGVLIFAFYHFHPIPLLWNPVERAKLSQSLAPAERASLEASFDSAQQARRRAAEAFLAASSSARPEAAERYRQAEAALAESRRAIVKRVEAASGKTYTDTNYIFLSYVLGYLPAGLKGLVIAVIFAAAMSTLSGELNALASASMIDLYRRFLGPSDHELALSRLFTAFWGVFASLIALRVGQLGSAIEVVNKFGSYFYGSILGVFGLAVLTRRATAPAAFVGLIVGMSTIAMLDLGATWTHRVPIHFLWYNVIGAVVVFGVGLALSRRRA
jgi:Na+/proline symporter